jgi:hypothetical protein
MAWKLTHEQGGQPRDYRHSSRAVMQITPLLVLAESFARQFDLAAFRPRSNHIAAGREFFQREYVV